jgi:hypothetical protein
MQAAYARSSVTHFWYDKKNMVIDSEGKIIR